MSNLVESEKSLLGMIFHMLGGVKWGVFPYINNKSWKTRKKWPMLVGFVLEYS